ncbi:MAG: hypothetical protein JRD04_07905, partial [Deltaproteobacteria bacterium]|nr:hypothetical protein [Deltaproteobacteria bacterium]
MLADQGKPHVGTRANQRTANSVAILKPGIKEKRLSVAEKRPMRRYDCNQYLECLGKAALASNPKVPCDGCREYEAVDMFAISEGDMPGIIRLFQAVFVIKVADQTKKNKPTLLA